MYMRKHADMRIVYAHTHTHTHAHTHTHTPSDMYAKRIWDIYGIVINHMQ